MELGYFIRGIVIGFSIAAPVGPIGILSIQRTLNQGAFYGFVSGLGAATADGCYGLIGAYLSIYFLTLTNPMTILSFAAIFAGFGLGGANQSYLSAGLLVVGVFSGSAMWWLLLSSAAGLLRQKFTTRHLQWVNRISGIVIVGFGIFIIGGLIG